MATTLTDRQIRAAKCPDDRNQADLRDDQPRGLVLRVYKSGQKTWFLFYRRKEDNKRRTLKLGTYPGTSLKQAREQAEIELGRVAVGDDPQADRDAAPEDSGAPTLGEVSGWYLERYAKVHKRPQSYQMDVWQIEAYVVPHWGELAIDAITQADIRDLLQGVASGELAARGKPTKTAPRNLRALLSKMFAWAAEQGWLAGNPAAGVKLPVTVQKHLQKGGRDRVLSDEEIRTVWEQLAYLESVTRQWNQAPVSPAAFRLLLLTAQRPGEVMSMRWADLQDGSWWVIPGEVAKNGEANRVPLSPQALRVLDQLRPHTGESEWVLESPYKEGFPLTTIKTAGYGIVKRAEMEPWTPHDLRRTAASKMRSIGVSRQVLQAILNHKDRSVTAVYDRYGMDREKMEALTRWGERVEQLVGGGSPGVVVDFPEQHALRLAAS